MSLTLVLFLVVAVQTESDFLVDPQSTTVEEGQSVTLNCRLQYFNSGETCSSYSYYWRRTTNTATGEYVTNCKSVSLASNRISVSKDDGFYELDIRDVRLEDAGEYWCFVYYQGFTGIYRYTSQRARVTVNSFPKNPPTCGVLSRPVSVGSLVQLQCRLSPLDPPSLLTWVESTSRQLVPPGPSQPTDPGGYFLANRQITEADNHKAFTCIAGPDQDRGPNCTVTPLQVPTNVSVEPVRSLTITEGETASFRCVSESIPEAYEFRWRLMRDTSDIKVNLNTVSILEDRYKLSTNGQNLEIVETSIAVFDNTQVRCIAITTLESVSSEDTLLIVVPPKDVSTQTASTKSTKGPMVPAVGNDGTSPGLIVGGVVGVILLTAIIAALACYLFRSRARRKSMKRSPHTFLGHDRIGMTATQASPTYEELPQGPSVQSDDQSGALTSDDGTNDHSHVYDTPDRNRLEETSPIYANSPGYANLPRPNSGTPSSSVSDKRPSTGQVIYASPDKRKGGGTRPDPIGADASASSDHPTDDVTRQEDPKLKNVEGLVYADLELETPKPTKIYHDTPDESTSYASIRGDMSEVKRMLSRD